MLLFERYPLLIGVIFILLSATALKLIWKKKFTFVFFYGIFCFYLLNVLNYTIFPIPVQPEVIAYKKEDSLGFMHELNLIPFNYIDGFDVEILLNVILSVPFGFGIHFLKRIPTRKIIFLGILFGITVELLQLIISLCIGFPYRYIDINDVIHNFAGVMIGFLVFRMFSLLYIQCTDRFKIPQNEFLAYIYEVCSTNQEEKLKS